MLREFEIICSFIDLSDEMMYDIPCIYIKIKVGRYDYETQSIKKGHEYSKFFARAL